MRLHDGETQILAGLISDEDRRTASGVPGLGQLPLLGRLFSQGSDQSSKTEIVLLITPRIVRSLQRPADVPAELQAGTEAGPGTAPMRLPSVRPNSLALTPSGGGGGAGAPGGGFGPPALPGGGAPSALPGLGGAPIGLPGMTPPAPPNLLPRPPGAPPAPGLPGQPSAAAAPSPPNAPAPPPGLNFVPGVVPTITPGK